MGVSMQFSRVVVQFYPQLVTIWTPVFNIISTLLRGKFVICCLVTKVFAVEIQLWLYHLNMLFLLLWVHKPVITVTREFWNKRTDGPSFSCLWGLPGTGHNLTGDLCTFGRRKPPPGHTEIYKSKSISNYLFLRDLPLSFIVRMSFPFWWNLVTTTLVTCLTSFHERKAETIWFSKIQIRFVRNQGRSVMLNFKNTTTTTILSKFHI